MHLTTRFALATLTPAIIGLTALTGCNNDRSPTAPMRAQAAIVTPQMEISAATEGRTERGIEDDILRMEGFVPGLGGAYLDNDTLVVYGPAGASRAQVLAGLARAAVTLTVDPGTRDQMVKGERIKIREGRYAFSQLVAWAERSGAALGSVTGVSGLDADEQLNAVSISIVREEYREAVLKAETSIGIPADAIAISVRAIERPATSLTLEFRPTGDGVQIMNANQEVCTIGFNVLTNGDGPGFYTASHCALGTPGAGALGFIYQPTLTGGSVAEIKDNPVWNSTSSLCLGHSLCAKVDAMYVKYTAATAANKVAITDYLGVSNQGGSTNQVDWWTNVYLGSTDTYFVGGDVDKVGRTTGWTRGKLSQSCVTTIVTPLSTPQYAVLCADKVTNARAGEGDSGAPVFIAMRSTPNTDQLKPLGILFSQTTDAGPPGQQYCTANCVYSFNRWNRVQLFVPHQY